MPFQEGQFGYRFFLLLRMPGGLRTYYMLRV